MGGWIPDADGEGCARLFALLLAVVIGVGFGLGILFTVLLRQIF